MKVEVKKVDELKREMRFEVSKERVSSKLDEVYKDINKNAKIKGFRPGKVPRHVLENKHSGLANEELLRGLVPEVYQEAIVKEELKPVDYPEVEDINLKDGILTFTAKLELRPEVDIKEKDYKGVKVKQPSLDVSDDEINKTLEYFKQGQGQDKDAELNDDFAKGLGYPNLDEFKKSLKRQIEVDKDRQNKAQVEGQIIDSLLKSAKCPVPESLVVRQLEQRVQQGLEHMKKKHSASKEDLEKKEKEMRESLKDPVKRDVKLYFILEKIADQEKIEVKEGENLSAKVMEFLLKEAIWEGK